MVRSTADLDEICTIVGSDKVSYGLGWLASTGTWTASLSLTNNDSPCLLPSRQSEMLMKSQILCRAVPGGGGGSHAKTS